MPINSLGGSPQPNSMMGITRNKTVTQQSSTPVSKSSLTRGQYMQKGGLQSKGLPSPSQSALALKAHLQKQPPTVLTHCIEQSSLRNSVQNTFGIQLKAVSQHAVLTLGQDDVSVESARSRKLGQKVGGVPLERGRLKAQGTLDIVGHGSQDGATLGGLKPLELAHKLKQNYGLNALKRVNLVSCHSEQFRAEFVLALQEVGIEVAEVHAAGSGKVVVDRQSGQTMGIEKAEHLGVQHDGTLNEEDGSNLSAAHKQQFDNDLAVYGVKFKQGGWQQQGLCETLDGKILYREDNILYETEEIPKGHEDYDFARVLPDTEIRYLESSELEKQSQVYPSAIEADKVVKIGVIAPGRGEESLNAERLADVKSKLEMGDSYNLDPIQVKVLPGDKYEIVGGNHRYFAAKALGIEDIPIQIVG